MVLFSYLYVYNCKYYQPTGETDKFSETPESFKPFFFE